MIALGSLRTQFPVLRELVLIHIELKVNYNFNVFSVSSENFLPRIFRLVSSKRCLSLIQGIFLFLYEVILTASSCARTIKICGPYILFKYFFHSNRNRFLTIRGKVYESLDFGYPEETSPQG